MEEIKIPEGTKSMACNVEENKITLEFIPKDEFKDGDILVSNNGEIDMILIFNKIKNTTSAYYHVLFNERIGLRINNYCDFVDVRHATEEEKQKLFDAMAKEGLKWNAEKKQIEKTRWRAEHMGYYYIDTERRMTMEREILFRAQMTEQMAKALNCVKRRWVEGYYYKDLCNGKLKSYITDGAHMFEIIDSTVGQYIGLKDINGKEIYEGDIVKGKFPYASTCLVEWSEKRCGFYFKPLDGLKKAGTDIGYKINSVKVNITGNIYDNPELLKS